MAEGKPQPPAAVRRLHRVGRGAALAALGVGIAQIVGIAAGIGWITAPIPGRPPISGMAALIFTLAAIALLVDHPAPGGVRRATRNAIGVAVSLLAAVALVDNVFDLWPGVGMPSIPASMAMIAFSAALVSLDRSTRGGRRPAEALGAVVGFVGFVTLLGHILDAPQLYRPAPDHHGTALAGSIGMCLLAVAVLCARPTEGLVALLASPTRGGTTARHVGLSIFLVIPGLGLVIAVAQRLLGFDERTAFTLLIAITLTLALADVAHLSTDLEHSDRELARASAAERALGMHLAALRRASDAMSDAVARMVGTDLAPVLREIAEQARLVAGAEYAALGLASEDDPAAFEQLVTSGVPEHVLQALHGMAPRATGVLGDVVLRGKSIRTRNVTEHAESRGMPARHPPIRCLLGVPVTFAGSQIGSLLLGNKLEGEEFTEDDQRMVEMVAERAASALRAAQLHEVEARAREWLQAVIDQIPEPMLISDADGRLLHWNRAADLARGRPDAVGEGGLLDLRLPSGVPAAPEELPLAQALARLEPVTGVELALKTTDGASLPVNASAAPLRDPDGRVRGAVALFDDIGALKQIERMREEWTAVIAHDLRQPLNGISLHAQLVRRALGPGASERQLESIEHIRVSVQGLNRMIEDLLDATRIEASRLKLVRRTQPLAPLMKQILDRTPVPEHAIRLDAGGELPDVDIDAVRFEQVMTNLLSNAAKYGAAGAPIDVRLEREGAAVRVSVANEGTALDEAQQARLFTRFYRTPSAEAGPKRGLGLGLYITKGLVEAHGGRIWVESREQRTMFHFTLPSVGTADASGVAFVRDATRDEVLEAGE